MSVKKSLDCNITPKINLEPIIIINSNEQEVRKRIIDAIDGLPKPKYIGYLE